ncbi:hypothetical protein [Mesorhizobium sp. IMUNJ 23232]|uniref:hypothetical protein n=1 Tax=Mesorhizobium sp. IMUNJ 23232 TaxID=3376064 RepID=UPI0037902DE4
MNWVVLHEFKKDDVELDAPWLCALDSVADATHLKFEATGEWKTLDSVLPACKPDGLAGATVPATSLILATCRPGALIGKFGGSSAAHKELASPPAELVENEPFPIGSLCVVKLPAAMLGPVFIGFNTTSRPLSVKTISVKISGGRAGS